MLERRWKTWSVAALLVGASLARGLFASAPDPAQAVARVAPAVEEPRALEVSYPSADGGSFAGTLSLPAEAGARPAILLISGSGAQDRDETIAGHKPFRVIAERLARAGFVVLRADDRGAGATTAKPDRATIQTHALDARTALEFLRARPEVDPTRIGLLGHSEGSLIAALVAASGEDIAFIVSLAGPGVPGSVLSPLMVRSVLRASGEFPESTVNALVAAQEHVVSVIGGDGDERAIRAAVRQGLGVLDALSPAATRVPAAVLDARAESSGRQVSTPWFRSFIKTDPRPAWQQVRCPVLALNGERDPQVEPGPNLSAIGAALANNPDVTLRVLPRLNHLFQPAKTGLVEEYASIAVTFDGDALELIARWLGERAGGA